MPKMGVGNGSGWKDRIEQSSWVDSARWTDKSEATGPVEFLEAEPSAYRLSQAPKRPTSPISPSTAKIAGFGAAAVVLIALAIMSRPGDQDPASQLSIEEQILRQREAAAAELLDGEDAPDSPAIDEATDDGADDEGEGDGGTAGADVDADAETTDVDAGDEADEAVALPPIPELRSDLADDFPGVLFGYGPQQSVIEIRRSYPLPIETQFDTDGGEPAGMVQTSPSEIAAYSGGRLFSIPVDGGVARSDLPDGTVHPGDDGFLVVLERERERQAYVLGASTGEGSTVDDGIVVGNDLTVLGAWSGQVLVYQASKVWLLDKGGRAQAVTDGFLIGFNGSHLAMVRCDGPSSCRIEVGTPSQPSQRSVPVPETLAGRDIALWASTGSVSPDGTRLAIIDHRGAVQLPTWIDLETGEAQTKSESVDPESPVVWSPDGRWLAYAFEADLLVWDTEISRTWRIRLGRETSHLAWLEDPEAATEVESADS